MSNIQSQFEENEESAGQGNYLSGLAEDYFYATHPDERPYMMDKIEVARIIKEYENLTSTETQSPQTSGTSEKVSL